MHYAIANNKGGAGKTVITACLAEALAARGRSVMVVDLDPQANLTRRLGYAEADLAALITVSEVIRANEQGCASQAITGCRWKLPFAENIDLIPSRFDLENRVPEAGQLGSHHRLATALDGVTAGYDVVLLDCPPSLGHLTQLAMSAADHVLVPVVPEYDHVAGATRIRDFIASSASHLGRPNLSVAGVIINDQDRRRGLHTWHLDSLAELFGPLVWTPSVPSRSVLAEAADAAEPLRAQAGSPVRDLISIFDELADRLEVSNAAA
ncbi:MAG: ParA family protein [Pseudonocardia sp.]|nr:ParA family protein [Pseudonocardia sp.]